MMDVVGAYIRQCGSCNDVLTPSHSQKCVD
jgi:hypothetical protein